jgi:nuclear protein localization family protein 4
MRKLTSGVDKGKFVKLEKERTSMKIDKNNEQRRFSEMPSSITLNRQTYRHVDNVCFANQEIVERLLAEWRNTGSQQVGWLFGSYSKHEEVPLGITCTVQAIDRFPQTFSNSTLSMENDPNEKEILNVAKKLGLRRVGWIVTDHVPDVDGKVKNVRNADSHFVTAEEAIYAGRMQERHPNPCRLAPSGYYGSKFVTVVVTGNDKGEIDFRGYQISNQGQSLSVDGTIVPTIDAPEFGYTIESTDTLYCPDVFFREKDEYGNSITKIGRPLPIEYLLTDMGANFATEFTYKVSNKINGFNPRNVSIESFGNYFKSFNQDNLFDGLKDFNLLISLATNDMLPLKSQIDLLLDAVKSNDILKFSHFLQTTEWLTTQTILETTSSQPQGTSLNLASFYSSISAPIPMDGVDDELRMAIERSLRET